ncbi:uncharacterized protein [Nicotiana tomentosiformis]|uniref:uncharacterized protein n=1 Tax=Nicotiana tomentosiformis TaxID=4098 RepID=UPI00388C8FED
MSAPPGNWEGQSTTRLPLFSGQYYSWWKNRMRDHIIGEDYVLWNIVTYGPLATMKINDEGEEVPKTRADCTVDDLKKWEKNVKDKKWLMCGLSPDEYNRIQSCTTAKEIWDTLQVAYEGTAQKGETIQEMYTRFTTLTNKLKSLGRTLLEEDKVEKILTRESKNIATLRLDVLIGNLTAYELRRQTLKMDVPKKERSLALRITEGVDLEEDEIAMITKDFKKYLMRGKGSSRGGNYNKARVPEKTTNKGCYKCGKTDHHIKNCPQWEIKWKKERSERRNRKKEQVHPKKNKGSTKAMVATWGESSDEESDEEDGDEKALMAIGESDEESELSKDCVILKAKCKNQELRVSETVSENTTLKNQVHTFEANVLELKSEYLKLKLGTSKKTTDCTQLTLEENEHHSSNRRGLGFGNQLPKWDPKNKYLTLPKNKICTHCGKTDHYKSECNAKERVQVKGSSQIWYMDSGCSKHITRSKDQFLSLEDVKGGNVSFGNGKKGEIIGVGKVGKDDSHSIENVYLIDDLKYSLISVSQLCDRGNLLAFTSTKYFVINLVSDKIVLQGKREHDDEVIGLGNLTEGIEQRGNDSQTSMEPVHEPVPQQQSIERTSRGNQLVVKPYKIQTG